MERLRVHINIINRCFLAAAGPCAPASEELAAAEGELDAVVAGNEEEEVTDPGRAVFLVAKPIKESDRKTTESRRHLSISTYS